MTRYSKGTDGKYHIHGSKFEVLIGSRAQVMHGTAYKTSGGLKKKDLMQNKSGRIVSKAKHVTAKKEKRLVKHGYGTQKGKFGYVMTKKAMTKSRSKSRKMAGGAPYGASYSPAGIDGQGITNYSHNSTDVQMAAGMAGGAPYGSSYSPAGIDGQGVTNYGSSSIDVQMAAGMAGGRRHKRGGIAAPRPTIASTAPVIKPQIAGGSRRHKRGGIAAPRPTIASTAPTKMHKGGSRRHKRGGIAAPRPTIASTAPTKMHKGGKSHLARGGTTKVVPLPNSDAQTKVLNAS